VDHAVPQELHHREASTEQPPQILHDRLEDRFGIRDGAADRGQDFARGRLVIERHAEVVGALEQLVEQARILDRDDRLGRKILDQLDMLVAERPNLLPENAEGTN
jgi:hypothetical protein